ncbi:MAG: LemA family protein [Hyphomonadaceae bacterium]
MTVMIWATVLAILLFGIVIIFNGLVGRRQMVRNGWADIDVQLKRRADLIPRLVDTVKAYASHERQLFEEVASRRALAQEAGSDPAARGAAESEFSRPVARLMALAEAYPELKANQNFLELQKELADTEGKIEMARRFFNGAARELNTAAETFPGNLIAGLFGFQQTAYFEIETADRAAPSVSMGQG